MLVRPRGKHLWGKDVSLPASRIIHAPNLKPMANLFAVHVVGPECSGDIKPGDIVITARHSGTAVTLKDENGQPDVYLIIHEDLALAVLES